MAAKQREDAAENDIPPLDRNIETSLDNEPDEVLPPDLDELADFLDAQGLAEGIKHRKNEPRDGRSDEVAPDDSTDAEVS